jgi:dTMP kinase
MENRMNGLFVTFEGIDGCGKSTQVREAQAALGRRNVPCMVTREPGGTPISEKIRDVLLSPDNGAMCNACEVLLYLAARAQHVCETIKPALSRGTVVLCDRFMEATYAYQGFGRGFPLDLLQTMNGFSTGGLSPSLTLVFDIDVETAFKRLEQTNKQPDRLEGSGRDFFEKVRNGYLELASRYPERIVVLKGTLPVPELSLAVVDAICTRLNK